MSKLTPIQYQVELQAIFTLAALTRQRPIADVLEAMDRADTLGPILDPTLYLQAAASLQWQRETVMAALRFRQAIDDIYQRYSTEEL